MLLLTFAQKKHAWKWNCLKQINAKFIDLRMKMDEKEAVIFFLFPSMPSDPPCYIHIHQHTNPHRCHPHPLHPLLAGYHGNRLSIHLLHSYSSLPDCLWMPASIHPSSSLPSVSSPPSSPPPQPQLKCL